MVPARAAPPPATLVDAINIAHRLTKGDDPRLREEEREAIRMLIAIMLPFVRVELAVADAITPAPQRRTGCVECGGPLPYGGHVSTPLCDACLSVPMSAVPT